jgi:cobalt/nickel transport system permease protein
VASPSDPRRDRALLASWLIAAFAISAVTDLRALGLASVAAALVFRAGSLRAGGRVLRSVVPVTAGLALASWAWLWALGGAPPDPAPYAALALRAILIAFVGFSVLARVDLLRALAPWPTATRLLVVTLAQVHALRMLVVESRLGLRSRLLRKPGALDVVRGAGGITGALFTLQARNARDIADALRARGF